MPAPWELPQQIPTPPGKSLDAKAPGWGQMFGANPQGCAGGMVMDEIDTCISISRYGTSNLVNKYSLLYEINENIFRTFTKNLPTVSRKMIS